MQPDYTYYFIRLGEYGIVYKGFLVRGIGEIVTELVAIKTLKGLTQLRCAYGNNGV